MSKKKLESWELDSNKSKKWELEMRISKIRFRKIRIYVQIWTVECDLS